MIDFIKYKLIIVSILGIFLLAQICCIILNIHGDIVDWLIRLFALVVIFDVGACCGCYWIGVE